MHGGLIINTNPPNVQDYCKIEKFCKGVSWKFAEVEKWKLHHDTGIKEYKSK